MSTKIRRCLYIGLGGTGMNSILNTKKMFIDTYGEVPPMVGFLGIDTDGGAYKKTILSTNGDQVGLLPREQHSVQVEEPRPIYEHNKEQLDWFPQENLYALTRMMDGAGQIRSNGRFALWYHAGSIVTKINQCLSDITDAKIIDNDKYSVLDNKPEIHVCFSVCGGTGCGTFINLAYIIRKHCTAYKCKLVGYGVLADVFETMVPGQMPNVKPNAYGAIKDLDFLMHLSMNSDKVHVDNLNDSYETNEQPFDAFFFVDNSNVNGDRYLHVDDLCEMIGLSLVTAAGELSSASASTIDNVAKEIAAGNMDIKNKRAWASGLGVSQILFHTQMLVDVYSRLAAKVIAEQLLNSNNDMTTVANAWIDMPQVNIRENNGQDNVIDFMFSRQPRFPLADIDDKHRPDTEVNSWLTQVTDEADEVKNYQDQVRELLKRVKTELDKLVADHVNRSGGVKETIELLNIINGQIDLFLGEMNNEKSDFQARIRPLEGTLQGAMKDLADYRRPVIGKNRTDEKVEEVKTVVTNLAVTKREIVRRTAAISFYNGLKVEIENYQNKLNNLKGRLENLINDLKIDVNILQNNIGRGSKNFQIDLTPSYAQRIAVNRETLLIADFIQAININGHRGDILDLLNCNKETLKRSFLDYTIHTREASQWTSLTIDDAIEKMDSEELKDVVRRALAKSEPLFPYSYQSVGIQPSKTAQHFFYIGVCDKGDNRLLKDGVVQELITTTNRPEFCSIGSKDSIIFYRQVGVVPPYVISSLKTYEGKYDTVSERVNCHFDHIIEQRMVREDYSLLPEEKQDITLEIWVKGFIFGVIRNNGGTYEYIDEENEDAVLDDYWTPLSAAENDRAQAFGAFKRLGESALDRLVAKMEAEHLKMGDEQYALLKDDARANYEAKFSQLNLTRDQLNSRGYEDVKRLFIEEMNFVKKEL